MAAFLKCEILLFTYITWVVNLDTMSTVIQFTYAWILLNELKSPTFRLCCRFLQASMKEDLLQQVRSDMESLQRQQKESLNKIATRDEVLQKLNSELGKLRSIKQEKQLEVISSDIFKIYIVKGQLLIIKFLSLHFSYPC